MINITIDFICDGCGLLKTIASVGEYHLSMYGTLTVQHSFFKRAGLEGWILVNADRRLYCPDCAKERWEDELCGGSSCMT